MEKSDNNGEDKKDEQETPSDGDLLNVGFAPEPVQSDAVEEALAVAESIVPEASESISQVFSAERSIGDSSSLKQLIDRAEESLRDSHAPSQVEDQSVPEELDALDIEAELGRPDEAVKTSIGWQAVPQVFNENIEDSEEKEEVGVTQTGGTDDIPQEEEALTASVVSSAGEATEEEETLANTRPSPSDDEITHLQVAPLPSGEMPDDDSLNTTTSTQVKDDHYSLESDSPSSLETNIESRGLRFSRGFCKQGEMAEDPLWTLLLAIYADKLVGELVLTQKGMERRIIMESGEAVMATSSARDDRLVELLYREGRLSDEEYSQAVLTVGASGRRVGAVLVERGFIASRELFPLVRHHYESIILDSFEWREGEWRFGPQSSVSERILLEVPTPTLIVEGIRSRADSQDIDILVPLGSKPVEVTDGICQLRDVGLLPEEVVAYRACDGTLTVEELSRRFNLPIEELRRLMAGLAVLGLIHVESTPKTRKKKLVSQAPGPKSVRSFRVERARVSDKMAQVKEASYFSILEVSPKASGYEIRKAYRSLIGQFAFERYAVPELVDLHDQVELVRFIIDEAYEVLRNPTLRESYQHAAGDD